MKLFEIFYKFATENKNCNFCEYLCSKIGYNIYVCIYMITDLLKGPEQRYIFYILFLFFSSVCENNISQWSVYARNVHKFWSSSFGNILSHYKDPSSYWLKIKQCNYRCGLLYTLTSYLYFTVWKCEWVKTKKLIVCSL